jgi:metal-dependent HD superfamily phosphatase/phosphodiesterase
VAENAAPKTPREAIEEMRLRAPARGNRKLEALLGAANGDDQLKAWWLVQQKTADRLAMSDHSWVHVQVVLNVALRMS